MARRRERPRGALESEVVACLAAADAPMTPGEVRAELGGDLAYTTVLTALVRLFDRRALTRSSRGRAYAYELVGGPEGARAGIAAHQMQKLLDAGTDRTVVLSRFVDGLDDDAEKILRDLLRRNAAASDRPSDVPAGKTRAGGRES